MTIGEQRPQSFLQGVGSNFARIGLGAEEDFNNIVGSGGKMIADALGGGNTNVGPTPYATRGRGATAYKDLPPSPAPKGQNSPSYLSTLGHDVGGLVTFPLDYARQTNQAIQDYQAANPGKPAIYGFLQHMEDAPISTAMMLAPLVHGVGAIGREAVPEIPPEESPARAVPPLRRAKAAMPPRNPVPVRAPITPAQAPPTPAEAASALSQLHSEEPIHAPVEAPPTKGAAPVPPARPEPAAASPAREITFPDTPDTQESARAARVSKPVAPIEAPKPAAIRVPEPVSGTPPKTIEPEHVPLAAEVPRVAAETHITEGTGATFTPTKSDLAPVAKPEKVSAKTGMTPSQTEFLKNALSEYAHTQEGHENDPAPHVIEVPNDGRYTVRGVKQANALHVSLTGEGIKVTRPDGSAANLNDGFRFRPNNARDDIPYSPNRGRLINGQSAPAPISLPGVPNTQKAAVLAKYAEPEGANTVETAPIKPLTKPLKMDGTTRPEKPTPKAAPAFDTLHPDAQAKFSAAWNTDNIVKMQEYLTLGNKGLRAEFERRSGIKLPNTESGTRDAVSIYLRENGVAGPSLSEKLAQTAADAKAQLAKNSGKLTSGVDPQDVYHFVRYGAATIAKGVVDFADWSKEMISEFGDAIKPHLRAVHDAALRVHAKYATGQKPTAADLPTLGEQTPPKAKPAMAGSINLGHTGLSPEDNAKVAAAADEFVKHPDYPDKINGQTVMVGARALGYNPDFIASLRTDNGHGGVTYNAPHGVDPNLHAVAIREQATLAQTRMTEAQNAHADNPTPETQAALDKATEDRNVTHAADQVVSRHAGQTLQSFINNVSPIEAAKAATEVKQRLVNEATPAEPKPAPPAIPKVRTRVRTPSGADRPGFGTKNKIYTQDVRDQALAGLKALTGRAHADPFLGLGTLTQAMPHLVKLGGYYLEGGLRSFGDWANAMRAHVPLTDDEAQLVYARTREDAQAKLGQRQKAAANGVLADELRDTMGAVGTANFFNEMYDHPVHGNLLGKILKGDLSKITPDERMAIEESRFRNTPARSKPLPSAGAKKLLKDISDEVNKPVRQAAMKAAAAAKRAATPPIPRVLTPDQVFDRGMAQKLGGKAQAEAFRKAVSPIIAKLIKGDALTPEDSNQLVGAYRANKLVKPGTPQPASLQAVTDLVAEARRVTTSAASEARKAATEAAKNTPEAIEAKRLAGVAKDFQRPPSTREPSGRGAVPSAKPERLQGHTSDLPPTRPQDDPVYDALKTRMSAQNLAEFGYRIEHDPELAAAVDNLRKQALGEGQMTEHDKRVIAQHLDDLKRTRSGRNPSDVSKLLTDTVKDVRNGNLGYSDAKELVRALLHNQLSPKDGLTLNQTAEAWQKHDAAMTDLDKADPGDFHRLGNVYNKHSPVAPGDKVRYGLRGGLLSAPHIAGMYTASHIGMQAVERGLVDPVHAAITGGKYATANLGDTGRAIKAGARAVPGAVKIMREGTTAAQLRGLSPYYRPDDIEGNSLVREPLPAHNLYGAFARPSLRFHGGISHILGRAAEEGATLNNARLLAKVEGGKYTDYLNDPRVKAASLQDAHEQLVSNKNAIASGVHSGAKTIDRVVEKSSGIKGVGSTAEAVMAPFLTTPLNIAGRGLEYSGLGVPEGAWNYARSLMPKYADGKDPFDLFRARQHATRQLARGVAVGGLAATVGTVLTKAGILNPPDRATHENGSINWNGKRYEINRVGGAVALPVELAGETYLYIRGKDHDFLAPFTDAMGPLTYGSQNMESLQGAATAKPGSKTTGWQRVSKILGGVLSEAVPGGGFFGDVASATDPKGVARIQPGLLGASMAKYPGLRELLKPAGYPQASNIHSTGVASLLYPGRVDKGPAEKSAGRVTPPRGYGSASSAGYGRAKKVY
jgi:hypothetical protein